MSIDFSKLRLGIDYVFVRCKNCKPESPDPNCDFCDGRGKHEQLITDDAFTTS